MAGPTALHKECEILLESLHTLIPVQRDHTGCRGAMKAFFFKVLECAQTSLSLLVSEMILRPRVGLIIEP